MTEPRDSSTASGAMVDSSQSAKLARQATAGLWCGILALVFFILIWVAGLVGALTIRTDPGPQPHPSIAVGIAVLACGGLSVVLSIAAIVLGALGRRPGNATNCGAATAGMVSGIVTLGLNFCCMMLGALVLLLGVRGFR